jgi:uncharacterized protein YndB with AHSA1/START domain
MTTTGSGSAAVSADRIEKHVTLRAPRERVWQALTDSTQFGEWFRVKLEGPFVVGSSVSGNITHPGYEHVRFTVQDVQLRPQDYFAYRWHPYGVDKNIDYTQETPTLVEFTLADAPDGGTLLTVVESGFEHVPAYRRDEAFRMNSKGWTSQMENIRQYVEG